MDLLKLLKKAEKRFWTNVLCKGPDDCWFWMGNYYSNGYGQFSIARNKIGAHKYAWISRNGSVENGLEVCHHCDNKGCCNPSHLFIGTHQDNMIDKITKGRQGVCGPRRRNWSVIDGL